MWFDKCKTILCIKSNLSSKKDREDAIQRFMSQIKEDIYSTITLLLTPIPLFKSESAREETFNELNRHQVLHGEVTDYGTEQNSLKMISFLSYLCGVLDYPNDEAT